MTAVENVLDCCQKMEVYTVITAIHSVNYFYLADFLLLLCYIQQVLYFLITYVLLESCGQGEWFGTATCPDMKS